MIRTAFLLVVTVLLGSAFLQGWISDYFAPSAEQKSNLRQRTSALPGHMGKSVTARFERLPQADQLTIRRNLSRHLLPVNTWLDEVTRSRLKILCLGEEHEQSTRSFLAKNIFSRLDLDVLMLESTPQGIATIKKAMLAKQSFVPLEGADISALITAARAHNPGILITGIEETEQQRKQRIEHSNTGFRDDVLAGNFWKRFQSGKRHVLIFGALHCSDESNWLYAQLRHNAPESLHDAFLNIRVFGEYQNESVQSMVHFLDQAGITRENFVIPDTRKLHPEFKSWFELLTPELRGYKTLLVFRTAQYLNTQATVE